MVRLINTHTHCLVLKNAHAWTVAHLTATDIIELESFLFCSLQKIPHRLAALLPPINNGWSCSCNLKMMP